MLIIVLNRSMPGHFKVILVQNFAATKALVVAVAAPHNAHNMNE